MSAKKVNRNQPTNYPCINHTPPTHNHNCGMQQLVFLSIDNNRDILLLQSC